MKKIFYLFIPLLIILAPIFWWKMVSSPVNRQDSNQQVFVIPQGAGINQIGADLKKQGLIKSPLAFKVEVIELNILNKIQAGDYYLAPSMSLLEICQTLTHGTLDLWVTIPEGLRKEEIALIIEKKFKKAAVDFDTEEFVKLVNNMEGYLFPDTYLIPKKASPQNVIDILSNTFEAKFSTLNNQSNLTKDEVVILSSIIERETKSDEDRKIVSGILIKRLNKDWPLQVDASLQYGKANTTCNLQLTTCDNWWPKILPEDLETESVYNTYLNPGLPPAPICNPGLASLQAATNPKDSPYWYYLSDKKGKIHYAKTLEEQDENIKEFLISNN